MPPKRKREAGGEVNQTPEPRTSKRSKKGTPASQVRNVSIGTDPSDDELTAHTPTKSIRTSARKPKSTVPARVTDKSSKSTTSATNDPAIDLLLGLKDVEQEETENNTQRESGFEAYFEKASRKSKTSNNTLSTLPVLSQKEYKSIIGSYSLPYASSCAALEEAHQDCFEEWAYEMETGFSLCLYGYGSKRSLITDFVTREQEVSGDAVVVVNGYHPTIDLRLIYRTIMAGLDPTSTASDLASVLHAVQGMSFDRLVLAIHNIDGTGLRNEKTQASLAQLVANDKVRLICSIDHVNAGRLWSSSLIQSMSLLFHDATTFKPYTLETELLGDVLGRTGVSISGDRGVKWILQTLSRTSLKLFSILLKRQIETGEGMEARVLFEEASRAFAVSNRTGFNSQLQEFLDHEIIVSDSLGILKVPFTADQCATLMKDLEDG